MSKGVVLPNSKLCVYWGLFMIFFFSVPQMYLSNFECASHSFNCRGKVNFNIDLASSHYWLISGKYLIILIFPLKFIIILVLYVGILLMLLFFYNYD